MHRSSDSLPPAPELPSFTVEGDLPASEEERLARVAERHAGTGLVRHDVVLNENDIDPDAAKVVRRLERSGYQAYLVGGCVRDLLLNRKPKDFDIATDARPDDVRSLFRNCRVIGRRFRLAHVLFGGGKIIEVATFRRNPGNSQEEETPDPLDDLLIRNDNSFGEAHEDALRRDFSINGLFYDLNRRQVLDWCNGLDDVHRRNIVTIGEPHIRFREDPIRILRAIKFAARLDLGIAPHVLDAMVHCREDLARAARPRVFEEILRLMRGGAAHRSMWLFWESGAMAVLIPELSAFLDDEEATGAGAARFWRKMGAIDRLTRERGRPLDDIVLWTALLQEPLAEACSGERDAVRAAYECLEPIIARIAMPRRIADSLRRILAILPRLAQGKVGRLAKTEIMGLAIDALEVDLLSRNKNTAIIQALRPYAADVKPASSSFSRRPRNRGPRPFPREK